MNGKIMYTLLKNSLTRKPSGTSKAIAFEN